MKAETAKKILIADDEEETLAYLSNILKRCNYEVVSTTKGKEALEFAKKIIPDLILLDIVMPDMCGNNVSSALSEDSATANIPIIFLTGILRKEEELMIKRTGRYSIMAKPVDSNELLEMVQKVLS